MMQRLFRKSFRRRDRFCVAAVTAWLLLAAITQAAELDFAPLFTDHAVLQRDVPLRIRGKGEEERPVTVDFAGQRAQAVVQNGAWEVAFPPLPSGGPFDLVVKSGGEKKALRDIYLGDVWLAAGQSNMQMNFGSVPELSARADGFLNPRVRVIGVRLASSNVPLDTGISPHGWFVVTPGTLKWVSIAGYLFGSAYEKQTQVPVGIIMSNQGATGIEAWMSLEALRQVIPDAKAPSGEPSLLEGPAISELFRSGKSAPPTGLYNAMIAPLVLFPIKGVLWYQGENNTLRPMKYARLLGALIEGWRKDWGIGGMPFVIVQLSSYGGGRDSTGEAWAWLREQQQAAVDQTPATGLAISYDLGEYGDIHPRAKAGVAQRMLETYLSFSAGGPKQLGPRFVKSTIEGSRVRLSFESSGRKLAAAEVVMNKARGLAPGTDPEAYRAKAGTLAGFEICGADHQFVEANATIEDKDVLVESPAVPEPVAVRYAWKNFAPANLFDGHGYPAAPFRTDTFPPPPILGEK